jgi:cytochrome P450
VTDSLVFNPTVEGFFGDPYPHYREVRDAERVQHHPLGFWFVSHYEDVTQLLRSGLSVETRHLTGDSMLEQYRLPDEDRVTLSLSMLDRDPPDHTRLRSLVTKVFTQRAIAGLEPMIVRLVGESLDRIAERGSADLVEELAFPLPFAVISTMLGTPPTDHVRLRELTGTLVRSLEVVTDPEVLVAIAEAEVALSGMTREIIAWKRANPGDDLLTALIQAEQDGDKLSDDELVAQVLLLYVAGHETTVNLIANGVVALLRNPAQFALLRARPELAGNAVEELLRYDSPVQQTRRITTAPHVLAGREIPAGEFVIACLGSANRDERRWGPTTDTLDIERADAHRHVSFGAGPHHCVGAALARLEGRLAIGGLVSRFPSLALDGEVVWNGRLNLRGATSVPVRV